MTAQILDQKSHATVIRTEETGGALSFYLTSALDNSSSFRINTYGIGIRCSMFGPEEEAYIPDITCDWQEAEQLFETIVRNLVLPSTLKDVVEDYLQR